VIWGTADAGSAEPGRQARASRSHTLCAPCAQGVPRRRRVHAIWTRSHILRCDVGVIT